MVTVGVMTRAWAGWCGIWAMAMGVCSQERARSGGWAFRLMQEQQCGFVSIGIGSYHQPPNMTAGSSKVYFDEPVVLERVPYTGMHPIDTEASKWRG